MVEELFKKYYPEYVTEKGECLSPYWDLFSTGIECATDELNNEIAELKAYNEKLLDGDIEKHNKIVELEDQLALKDEELNCVVTDFNTFKSEAKYLIRQLCSMVRELNNPNVQLTNVDYSLTEAEQFLKECEK